MITTNPLTRLLFIIIGIISAGFGIEGYLIPNGLIDGGVTGVAMLTAKLTPLSLPASLLMINCPFIIISFRYLRWKLVIKGAVSILLLAYLLHHFSFPVITNDRLLASLFGGFFLGLGIGFTIRGDSVLDGTEMMALFIQKHINISIGDFILIFNIILFCFGIQFLGIETVMYSLLTYVSAAKTINFVLDGIQDYVAIFVISEKNDLIKQYILNNMERYVQVIAGQRGDIHATQPMLYFLANRFELNKLKIQLKQLDPNVTLIMHRVTETSGYFMKRPRLFNAFKLN